MDVFDLRDHLVEDYASYIRSFMRIRDPQIQHYVQERLNNGLLWPDPLIQLNPSFEPGPWINDLVADKILHEECSRVFRIKPERNSDGKPMRLHKHQADALQVAKKREHYVLTTGTGSGKSLSYIVPIVDHVLRHGTGKGIQAIIVYPMNALANSQSGELEKFLRHGYAEGKEPVTFARYTGQESKERRDEILAHPPDILLTNYVMLELILTRPHDKSIIQRAQGLRYLVLDEMHTYRGRQGADVALLTRRVREILNAPQMQCVGTSATLAGGGSFEEQRAEVARVAGLLFGASVAPGNVIGETLRRATPDRDLASLPFVSELTARVADETKKPPSNYQEFIQDPLSIWIESVFGITSDTETNRLVRSLPRSIAGENGAARLLAEKTKLPEERCLSAIQEGLLGGYACEPNPETGFPAFAFRLHQFISRGDTVYATLEDENTRYITTSGQQFVPGDRNRVLLPLVFCRECGQEYYCVRRSHEAQSENTKYHPRDLGDQYDDETGEAGFLYINSLLYWPDAEEELLNRLPDDWIETEGGFSQVRRDRRAQLPKEVRLTTLAQDTDNEGVRAHYFSVPFRFCLHCGTSYTATQRDDFSKLAALSSEGRSTATTILSLSAIRRLRGQTSLEVDARKLLSFTDNRQDASLQAGHFNDFVEIALLRSSVFAAVKAAGEEGLHHEELPQKVFEALALPKELYAVNPEARFQAEKETQRAFRNTLGYRIYRDLKRGWRVVSPNLEQCGLLRIRYEALEDACAAEDLWQGCHAALVTATPETRARVAQTLLDYMRRELAIKVDYLDALYHERLQQQSSQYLISPWALDEAEAGKLETSAVLYPRSRRKTDYRGNIYLSARGGFGQYLRRSATFSKYVEQEKRLKIDETEIIIAQLLEKLSIAGLVEQVTEPNATEQVAGYQVPASAFIWTAGDGTQAFHDPIRVPNQPTEGGRTNPFFVAFYQVVAADLHGLEAREHTAQVPYEDRQKREQLFREGKLPILYCSPTMELGVDISRLNVVNMRNVPPTPANYAQRSGRAGRSGQPALVFSYCTTGSPHDQYFFKRPELMVAGSVTPPRLELANEDLVRAHVHAIWLAETGLDLGKSLVTVLNTEGQPPALHLQESIAAGIAATKPREVTKARAERVLATFLETLEASDWWSVRWLEDTLLQVSRSFDVACNRWRELYFSALKQQRDQNAIILDASRPAKDKETAKRLRAEAEQQLKLLTEVENVSQSDFYSYRYFASEGFLPGYNFPRLPLSAYIPGRSRKQREEFLSRPRFLAISEFGPRSIIYHEGSQYEINKVILPVGDRDEETDQELFARRAKLCPTCGYLHPILAAASYDTCERCGQELGGVIPNLFRLQNVSTRRRERISCDEEERMRLGYEIVTGVRFADYGGGPSFRTARIEKDGKIVATLAYGSAATLWRINRGWSRRKNKQQLGFVLDMERGYWARNEQEPTEGDTDPLSARVARVIPYVEDRRNCLVFSPEKDLPVEVMTSLQAAIKTAVQIVYQLEDNEIAAEPLPDRENRRHLLLYEAAEGGAGVLRRLLDDPHALAEVATEALRLCHFDPETGADKKRAERSREDCEAACYDCLRSYQNQRDHELLDRKVIKSVLCDLRQARALASPKPVSRAEHRDRLLHRAGSELERKWLRHLDAQGFRLPTDAQKVISECATCPDFLYLENGCQAAIYIDGPPHDFPDRQKRDQAQTECMEDGGYLVIRFRHNENWEEILKRYPSLFGRPA